MEILRQLFNEEEIEDLIKVEEEIKYLPKEQVRKVLKFLSTQNCTNQMMRNIINTYPQVLLRPIEELEDLNNKLEDYGIKNRHLIFDKYPYFLMKEGYEIDTFFFQKMKEGLEEKDIIKILEEEPYKIELIYDN